jgi:phage baseplate assembly protein W
MDLEAQKDLLRRRLLGRGLALVRAGDLGRDLTLTPDGKDLALVDGVPNLAQALSVAVLTPLGGDVFETDFGFDGLNALVDETTPLLQRERVRVAIVTLLRKDPRVGTIVDVKLVDGRLEQPTTGAARQLDVRVVFETITGDPLTLTAGPTGTRLTHG